MQSRTYKVFRCRCSEWICDCDQFAEEIVAPRAKSAALIYAREHGYRHTVIVENTEGERFEIAFDGHMPVLT